MRGNGTNTTGYWDNTIGLYAGIDGEKIGVKGLGLSVGYTANFRQRETAQELKDSGDPSKGYTTFEVVEPFYSGIDIKAKFTGIEKMSVTFNNNISFTAVKGAGNPNIPGTKRIRGINGLYLSSGEQSQIPDYTNNYAKNEQGWFAYDAILGVTYSITPSLNATFALGNLLRVYSYEYKRTLGYYGVNTTTESTTKRTDDELRISLHAEYGVGNVTFGIGLNFGLVNVVTETETKTSGASSGKSSSKGELNEVRR